MTPRITQAWVSCSGLRDIPGRILHPSQTIPGRSCVLVSSGRLPQAVGDAECGGDTEEQAVGCLCSSPRGWEQWRWDVEKFAADSVWVLLCPAPQGGSSWGLG